jgi:hypothetical protein
MKKYHFKTNEFGASENGLHLLRSDFNYETIVFSQIHRIDIGRGKELNNWFIILIIGLALLTPGLYISLNVITALYHGDINFKGARIVILLLIPLVGAYFIFTSLQSCEILKIVYGNDKNMKLSLREIVKKGEIDEFKLFMKSKLNYKVRTND